MARMHARRKGKSGSRKPSVKSPEWVRYKPAEIVKLVEKMGSKGMQSAAIGRELRDVYGVPDVKALTGKKISSILKETKNYGELPEDLFNLLKRAVKIKKHLEVSKKDLHSNEGFRRAESKIKRLVKYYKDKKVLDKNWVYDIETAKILVE
ncbi:MAG: 30S ribosomal protein S15 [Nanoarchaeota archaeon]|nr:30S ribosomal protein S15 [Nanoarchaeota archaeon]